MRVLCRKAEQKSKDQRMPSGGATTPISFPPKINPTNNAFRVTCKTKAWEVVTIMSLQGAEQQSNPLVGDWFVRSMAHNTFFGGTPCVEL